MERTPQTPRSRRFTPYELPETASESPADVLPSANHTTPSSPQKAKARSAPSPLTPSTPKTPRTPRKRTMSPSKLKTPSKPRFTPIPPPPGSPAKPAILPPSSEQLMKFKRSSFKFKPRFTSDGSAIGFPSIGAWEKIRDEYLLSLTERKRGKALVTNQTYIAVHQVLSAPHDLTLYTAQFRYWVRKMFEDCGTLLTHSGKPVVTSEQMYSVLVQCHAESGHGGRDATALFVNRDYSWVPKECVARFVKLCPTCDERRPIEKPTPSRSPSISLALASPQSRLKRVLEDSDEDVECAGGRDDDDEWLPSGCFSAPVSPMKPRMAISHILSDPLSDINEDMKVPSVGPGRCDEWLRPGYLSISTASPTYTARQSSSELSTTNLTPRIQGNAHTSPIMIDFDYPQRPYPLSAPTTPFNRTFSLSSSSSVSELRPNRVPSESNSVLLPPLFEEYTSPCLVIDPRLLTAPPAMDQADSNGVPSPSPLPNEFGFTPSLFTTSPSCEIDLGSIPWIRSEDSDTQTERCLSPMLYTTSPSSMSDEDFDFFPSDLGLPSPITPFMTPSADEITTFSSPKTPGTLDSPCLSSDAPFTILSGFMSSNIMHSHINEPPHHPPPLPIQEHSHNASLSVASAHHLIQRRRAPAPLNLEQSNFTQYRSSPYETGLLTPLSALAPGLSGTLSSASLSDPSTGSIGGVFPWHDLGPKTGAPSLTIWSPARTGLFIPESEIGNFAGLGLCEDQPIEINNAKSETSSKTFIDLAKLDDDNAMIGVQASPRVEGLGLDLGTLPTLMTSGLYTEAIESSKAGHDLQEYSW